MAQITLGGNPVQTMGELPAVGEKAPDFTLIKDDLARVSLSDFQGSKVVLNVFPSIDTSVCAQSVREFNQRLAEKENTKVLCISRDLPFAFKRFCAAEGIENVETLSDFESGDFGKTYQLEMTDGPFAGLHSRAVIVLDEDGKVIYQQQVGEIGDEPDYKGALAAL